MLSKNVAAPAIDQLAIEIATQSARLQDYFATHDTAPPSFDKLGPDHVLPCSAPEFAQKARMALADAAYKMLILVTGPSKTMLDVQLHIQTTFALRWLFHFGIFHHVPIDRCISYDEIALAANVPVSQLKSVVRMVMTRCIFEEPEPDIIQHNAFSIAFVKSPALIDGSAYVFDISIPTAMKMVEATERWPGSVQNNQTAHSIAFNTTLSHFDYMQQDKGLTSLFSKYMLSMAYSQGMDLQHLVVGFDWSSLPDQALTVDIGGSSGHCSFAVAKAFPSLRFEVQDLPSTVPAAGRAIDRADKVPCSSVSFRAHNFFSKQPVRNADVYFLRLILHDWPDADAVAILRNVSEAMNSNSKLVVMDTVLPQPYEVALVTERINRMRDLTMRQKYNAKERTIDDWRNIIQRANPALRIHSITLPAGSELSLIVVKLEGSERPQGSIDMTS